MNIVEKSKLIANTTQIALTLIAAERYVKSNEEGLALDLSRQALRGVCDPLVAEAELAAYMPNSRSAFMETEQAERGSKAVASLVMAGAIDPLYAENILDEAFHSSAFQAAADEAARRRM